MNHTKTGAPASWTVIGMLIVSSPGVVDAQSSLGEEVLINTYTTGPQRFPSVCMAGGNEFVVAWEDGRVDSSQVDHSVDGSETAVVARRLGGEPPSGDADFLVNTYTTGRQGQPSVACLDDDGFVVVWSEAEQYLAPNDGRFGVFGRRYDSAGTPGDEFAVDAETPQVGDPPSAGSVCRGPGGGFVVVWNVAEDTVVRLYDAQGAPGGTDVHVPHVDDPKCCGSAEGFVMAGLQRPPSGPRGVSTHRFSDSGELGDTQFLESSNIRGNSRPALACNSAGQFVVVWEEVWSYGYDIELRGQRFAADGEKVGGEFPTFTGILEDRTEAQHQPTVAMGGAGQFIVVWGSTDESSFGYFPNEFDTILAREFDASAKPVGGRFEIATSTANVLSVPSVATDADGEVLIAWQTKRDGDDHSISARRYTLGTQTAACGDANDGGDGVISATDALVTLSTAVGLGTCEPCVCDVDNGGSVTATDALMILNYVVGVIVSLECVPCQ